MNNITTDPKSFAPRKILKPIIKPTDPVEPQSKGCCCSGKEQVMEDKPEVSSKSCCSKS